MRTEGEYHEERKKNLISPSSLHPHETFTPILPHLLPLSIYMPRPRADISPLAGIRTELLSTPLNPPPPFSPLPLDLNLSLYTLSHEKSIPRKKFLVGIHQSKPRVEPFLRAECGSSSFF